MKPATRNYINLATSATSHYGLFKIGGQAEPVTYFTPKFYIITIIDRILNREYGSLLLNNWTTLSEVGLELIAFWVYVRFLQDSAEVDFTIVPQPLMDVPFVP